MEDATANTKTHLYHSKEILVAACHQGYRSDSKGYVVNAKGFRELHESMRCKACEKVYLQRRNLQRSKKGLDPVKTWNE